MAGLKLYEITHEMNGCIDTETGEIDTERLGGLQMQFNDKALACAAVSMCPFGHPTPLASPAPNLMLWIQR